jgi:hypothetical protein
MRHFRTAFSSSTSLDCWRFSVGPGHSCVPALARRRRVRGAPPNTHSMSDGGPAPRIFSGVRAARADIQSARLEPRSPNSPSGLRPLRRPVAIPRESTTHCAEAIKGQHGYYSLRQQLVTQTHTLRPTSLSRQYSSSGRSIRGADATLSCFAADRPNQGSSALRQTEPATLRPVKPPYSTTHQGHCDDIDHPQTR